MPHPALLRLAAMRARVQLLSNYTWDQVNEADSAANDLGLYASTYASLPADLITAAETAAPPGGFLAQILQAIMTFLASPQGQQLIAALVAMLISLIGGG